MAKLDRFIIDNTTYELVPEIAPLFNPATPYSVGDCVIHDAVLYKFTANHAAGAWTGNDVEAIEVADRLNKISDSVAPEFSASTSYTAGQYVYKNGVLYRFTTDHAAGAWTGLDATVVTVGGEVEDVKSTVDDMVLVTIGINKTDPTKVYNATINNSTGVITPGNNYYECSGKIPVTPGDTLYILWKVSDTDIRVRKTTNDRIAFYKADGTFISIGYNEDSYTVPSEASYCVEHGAQHVLLNGTVAVFTSNAPDVNNQWVAYTETRTIKNSYTPREVNTKLNEIDGCMKTTEYMDYSMVNRMNPSDCLIGKIADINTGAVFDNANAFLTDYMYILPGETLYFLRKNGELTDGINRYAAYDENKNIIPSLGVTADTDHVTQSQNMAYVRVAFDYSATDFYRSPGGIVVLPTSNPVFVPGYGAVPCLKSEHLRPVMRIYSTDTEAQIITKLVQAYNTSNCDVYFDRANYTFGEELAKVNTDYGMQHNEIPIGNNCRYYFNGAHLSATIDLSQHPASGNEEFYCNFFGCQRRPSSFELHDGVLEATDTRYIIHDESSALQGSYRHLYQNMELIYHTSARQEAIRKCIGGGTGASGVIEIVGCKFTTDSTDACVSYHGNETDVLGAEFDINVRNSWFSNNIRGGTLSEHQTARMIYTGNSSTGAPLVYDGWTLTSFLNELRV